MNWMYMAIVGGIGSLYFGAALADILTDWDRYKAKMQQRGVVASRLVMGLGAVAMLSAALAALYLGYVDYRKINPPTPKSIEAAQQFVPGTWVFSEPISADTPQVKKWQRWIIRNDGTLDVYQALPTSSDWGQAKTLTYAIITEKYMDTGQRFYAMHIQESTLLAIIDDDGAMLVKDADKVVAVLKRGDKNPFSK